MKQPWRRPLDEVVGALLKAPARQPESHARHATTTHAHPDQGQTRNHGATGGHRLRQRDHAADYGALSPGPAGVRSLHSCEARTYTEASFTAGKRRERTRSQFWTAVCQPALHRRENLAG